MQFLKDDYISKTQAANTSSYRRIHDTRDQKKNIQQPNDLDTLVILRVFYSYSIFLSIFHGIPGRVRSLSFYK